MWQRQQQGVRFRPNPNLHLIGCLLSRKDSFLLLIRFEMSWLTHTNAHIPLLCVACQATPQSGPVPNSLGWTWTLRSRANCKAVGHISFAARNSPKKFRCGCVSGLRVFPGALNPDGACDFHHVSAKPVSPRSPPLVSQAQQSHCAWAQTDCLYQPSETFHFSLSAILRDNFGTLQGFQLP